MHVLILRYIQTQTLHNVNFQQSNSNNLLLNIMNDTHTQVKVDTMLLESSDTVAKAILDLIPILNIKKLVVGTSKSRIR